MSIVTSAVADYGTRKLITTAAVQKNLYSYSVAMNLFDVDTTTTGVYRSPITNIANAVNEAVTGNSYVAADPGTSADVLPIDRRAIFSERVGGFDEVSFASGSLIADRVENASKVMSQSIDRFAINKAVTDAPTMLIDGGAVSTATAFAATPWTLSSTNALDVVNAIVQEVNFNEGYSDDKFIIADTSMVRFLTGFFQGTGNNVADETLRRGVPYVGTLAGGVKVYQSNNVPHYGVITLDTAPTAGQTLTIHAGGQAITFTFVATIGTTPGNILQTSTPAAIRARIIAALAAPGTTTADFVAFELDKVNALKNLEISAVESGATLQVSAKGAFRWTWNVTGGTNALSPIRKRLLAGAMKAPKLFVPAAGMKYQEKDGIGLYDGTEILMRQFFNSMTETRKKPLTVSVLTV